jgi:lysozyme
MESVKKKRTAKKTSAEIAAKIIKKYEGFMPEAYICPGGVPTIGYGSTMYENGDRVAMDDCKIDRKRGEEILLYFIKEVEQQVKSVLEVKLNNNQLAALVSLTYNIGIGNFGRSTLLAWINSNPSYSEIPSQFRRWKKSGGKVLKGLVARREEEVELWLS